jgi:hypothetical protein
MNKQDFRLVCKVILGQNVLHVSFLVISERVQGLGEGGGEDICKEKADGKGRERRRDREEDMVKGIFQPFELGGVTRLIRSAVKFWKAGNLKKIF